MTQTRRLLAIIAGAAIVGTAIGVTGTVVVAGSGNDRVLGEDDFTEFFTKSDRGNKNYAFTTASFIDAHGRECTVVGFADFTTGDIDCEKPRG